MGEVKGISWYDTDTTATTQLWRWVKSRAFPPLQKKQHAHFKFPWR